MFLERPAHEVARAGSVLEIQLGPDVSGCVMLLLVRDIGHHAVYFRGAYAECAVSRLPGEVGECRYVAADHSSQRRLELSHEIGNRDLVDSAEGRGRDRTFRRTPARWLRTCATWKPPGPITRCADCDSTHRHGPLWPRRRGRTARRASASWRTVSWWRSLVSYRGHVPGGTSTPLPAQLHARVTAGIRALLFPARATSCAGLCGRNVRACPVLSTARTWPRRCPPARPSAGSSRGARPRRTRPCR